MRNRIVLSTIAALFLFACGGPSEADDVATDGIGTSPSAKPDAGAVARGIGTSPSAQANQPDAGPDAGR